MKKIILASSSPRRKDILSKMGLTFEIVTSDYEEKLENDNFTYEKIEFLAKNKAQDVFNKIESKQEYKNAIIIAADTVVVLNNKILGKPNDEKDAKKTLQNLSGKKHSVVTSICMIQTTTKTKKTISETSYVEFNQLSEENIESYVSNFAPLDKAGSYGIQELPSGFINNIEGSFENIIGLCPKCVELMLKDFN